MGEPRPDHELALEFLCLMYPDGPWCLTAIEVDPPEGQNRKKTFTRTFHPGQEQLLKQWLSDHGMIHNIYWSVNPPIADVDVKAQKEHIKAVHYLQIDMDRVGDEHLERFMSKLPRGVPSPTALLFSGGGYQAFWKLEPPIPINGQLELAHEAERYGQQLQVLFGGKNAGVDSCHNVDRIMRLPGTVNMPDAKKRAKGRVPKLAVLLSHDPALVYKHDDFTKLPPVQIRGDSGPTPKQTVSIGGNVRRLSSIQELNEWGVPDRVKVICVQGRIPDEPKPKDNSRSAWLFDAVCQLVRAKVPDDVIFSVITDPEFGISESVLELGSSAERYAIRQIEKAKLFVIDPWLARMNDQFVVIGNMGGKCRVLERVTDYGLNRTRLTKMSFDDLTNRYMNQFVNVGTEEKPKYKSVGRWWLEHPMRRQCDTMTFAPNREPYMFGDGERVVYNLWKGFGVEARPGSCDLFLQHMMDNICGGVKTHYDYLLRWMARAVQQPASVGEVAIVLRGGKGTGKSAFAKHYGALFGEHFMHIFNPAHLVEKFNNHLRDVVFLFADEAFYANDKKHESTLKGLVTEPTLVVEGKYQDAENAPNYIHLMMASNSQHVIPASGDERRYCVFDVGDNQKQNPAYFEAIRVEMEEKGGRSALLHLLQTLPLDDWDVRKVPTTAALAEQKQLSLSIEEEWWYAKLQEGRLLPEHRTWADRVLKQALQDDFINHCNKWARHARHSHSTALGHFLGRVVPGLTSRQFQADIITTVAGSPLRSRRLAYHYVLPSLERCREKWDSLHGKHAWPEPLVEEEVRDMEQEEF
jgi:hypothetical protein